MAPSASAKDERTWLERTRPREDPPRHRWEGDEPWGTNDAVGRRGRRRRQQRSAAEGGAIKLGVQRWTSLLPEAEAGQRLLLLLVE